MVIASLLAGMLTTGLQPPAEMIVPTAIERGLLDRACRESAPTESGKCREEKLTALRADFGKDLAKLKVDDRKKVDSTCSPLLADVALKGRDPYFDCMLDQLTALRSKRKNANAAAAPAAAAPADTPADTPEAPAPPPPSGMSSTTLVVAGLGVVVLAGGLAFVVMRARVPRMRKCNTCGVVAVPPESESEMCPNCRKELSESLRKAKAEHAEQARIAADEVKREQEREAARREQNRMRELEERRVREYEEKRELEHASKVAEAVRPNEPEPPPSPFDVEAFDPHAILGVAPGATADAINAAYQTAKKKYDPDLVVHLSEEVQQHYREKAAAVDKAFQTLTGAQPA